MSCNKRIALLLPVAVLLYPPLLTADATKAANGMPIVKIPAGEFIMGSNKSEKSNTAGEFGNAKPWYLDEHPEHKEQLPAYGLDEHEVTNAQYREFVIATNAAPPQNWLSNGYILSQSRDKLGKVDVAKLRELVVKVLKLDIDSRSMNKDQLIEAIDKKFAIQDSLPVVYVTWQQANAYCKWAGERLPTEAEWERAARGTVNSEFPWGNEWKQGMSNTGEESWDDGAAPVESYQSDRSEFGVYDMAGNVSEWTADWYKAYPGSDYKSKDFGEKFRVVRGAAWGGEGHYALRLFQRAAYRFNLTPDSAFDDLGFRCAADINTVRQ